MTTFIFIHHDGVNCLVIVYIW